MTETSQQTGYAPVNDLQMYYEIHGSGDPLMLLHGAYGTTDLWGPILATLAEHRQVIAVEQQGHGHTADGHGSQVCDRRQRTCAANLNANAEQPCSGLACGIFVGNRPTRSFRRRPSR